MKKFVSALVLAGVLFCSPAFAGLKGTSSPPQNNVSTYVVTPTTGGTADTLADIAQCAIARAINTQTDSYTLVLGDKCKFIRMDKGTGQTLTIPSNSFVAFPVGTEVPFSQSGAGALTLVAATSTLAGNTNTNTTVNGLSSTASLGQYMTITGTGIPASTTIASVDSSTAITISQAATATATGITFTFSPTINHFSSGLVLAGQHAAAAIKKTGTDRWLLSGALP